MWIIIVSVWLRTYNLRVWELEKKPKFLILEPWITPSIFEEVNVGENKLKIVDEYTYAQYVDKEFAKTRLDRYKNWVTLWKINRGCMKFCRTLQRFWFLLLNSSHRKCIPWMYRGSPPYAFFGTWKKPCYMKLVLVGLYCGPLLMLIPPLTRT